MAQFIGLVTLNAENFDSGAATDGQVLTADGAGNAAWEAAGGGGGASFAFDGVTFTPGTFTADSGAREVEVEFTLGGNSIASGNVAVLFYISLGGFDQYRTDKWESVGGMGEYLLRFWTKVENVMAIYFGYTAAAGKISDTWKLQNDEQAVAEDQYIYIIFPNGTYLKSDAISVPGYVAPEE